ncbi:hypothetical protein M901_3286, partial [Bacteriovorax sp. DB6_IX]
MEVEESGRYYNKKASVMEAFVFLEVFNKIYEMWIINERVSILLN